MNEALSKVPWALGRYQILAEIARGAMGVVYKARDPLIDRVVAIKTVSLGLSDAETATFERRFFREAKSAGRLNHANVVTIHDVGKSGDVAYIAMEFLDGRSLRHILDTGVVLPPEKVADIGAQIAEGLAFAHRQGVVHRDVKPANIMVLHNGTVKITDFGIALLPTGTRTLAGNAFGSPRYTSPEQIVGRPVDGRSDIFSLGAVLYEMLTGLPPFSGGDLNSILTQVLSEPTPAPSLHNPKLPRGFDHIVGKALAKDPADRYQDADQLAADLRNYATLESDLPAPAPLPALEHPTGEMPAATAEAVAANDVAPAVAEAGEVGGLAALRRKPMIVGVLAAAIALAAIVVVALRPSPQPTSPVSAAITPIAPPPTPAAESPPPAPATEARKAAPSAPSPVTTAKETPAATAAAPESAEPAVAAKAVPPPPPKPMARIAFAVAPWGEVHVDGKLRGLSPPLAELRVAPGKHTIEIRNSTFAPYRETVDVGADGVVRIKHKFQ
ncbi:MAG: serine/threonine-protein kinase [Burkholderiales bacterium]